MAETFFPVDNLPDTPTSDKVNPTAGSDPNKKEQGFSKALREKMKEKLKKEAHKKDELVLGKDSSGKNEPDFRGRQGNSGRSEESDAHGKNQNDPAAEQRKASHSEEDEDNPPPEHIDFKA